MLTAGGPRRGSSSSLSSSPSSSSRSSDAVASRPPADRTTFRPAPSSPTYVTRLGRRPLDGAGSPCILLPRIVVNRPQLVLGRRGDAEGGVGAVRDRPWQGGSPETSSFLRR